MQKSGVTLGLFLILLIPGSCKDAGPVTSSGMDREKTLASLAKANDHPFYTMRFYGDYGFAERVGLSVSQSTSSSDAFSPLRLPRSSQPGFGVTSPTQPIRRNDSAWGCTCFVAHGDPADPQFGRNFDWRDCIPLLLFTDPPNGYASVCIVDLEYLGFNRANLPDGGGDKSALLQTPWYPFDGMNEKGVTVGMMAVPSAQAPYDPTKVTLGELGVIRLVLDFAATTDEAIALLREYNLRVENPPVHYLIADAGGHSAVIEYVNGTMNVLKNDEPWHVSTNFIITGSGAPANAPCWRYNTAYNELRTADGVMTSDRALSLLSKVSQTNTIWSVVYGMKSGTVLVTTDKKFAAPLTFSMSKNLPPKRLPDR
jgi:hypothetical protein